MATRQAGYTMKHSTSLTDVNRVVAFLSGIDTLRDEAIVTLAHSPAARALLCMAGEALDALGLSSTPPSPTQDLCPAETS